MYYSKINNYKNSIHFCLIICTRLLRDKKHKENI